MWQVPVTPDSQPNENAQIFTPVGIQRAPEIRLAVPPFWHMYTCICIALGDVSSLPPYRRREERGLTWVYVILQTHMHEPYHCHHGLQTYMSRIIIITDS